MRSRVPTPEIKASLKEHQGRAPFVAIPFSHVPSSILVEPRERTMVNTRVDRSHWESFGLEVCIVEVLTSGAVSTVSLPGASQRI